MFPTRGEVAAGETEDVSEFKDTVLSDGERRVDVR
jgi:hypothetical protein